MIWAAIIIAAIIAFAGGFLDVVYNNWNITKMLFVDSWWGIIAVVSGTISALLFYASAKTYSDVKISETFLAEVTSELTNQTKHKLKGKKDMSKQPADITNDIENYNKDREIDLAKTTMNAMIKKMAYIMMKPGPVFFKGWGNKRLELDVERVHIINDYIQAVRGSLQSYTHLRADALISFYKIEKLAQIEKNELLYQLKESKLKIDFLEKEYSDKVTRMDLDIQRIESELYEKMAHIEHVRAQTEELLESVKIRVKETDAEIDRRRKESDAEIELRRKESDAMIKLNQEKSDAEIYIRKLQAKDTSKISAKRSKLLDHIIKEMEVDNISPMDVYLLVKLIETDSTTTDFMDFDSKVKVVNEEIEKMKQQNKILQAEADYARFNTDRKMGKV